MRQRSQPITAGALAFQADLDRLVEEPPPFLLRLWPMLGAGLVVALVAIAAMVRIDVVVTATGRLAADAPPIILQPMSRATLRDLLVKPGDMVVAGQLLARLDGTLSQADRDALRVERAALAARLTVIDTEAAVDQHLARLDDLAQRQAQAGAALLAFDIDQRRQMTEALADLTPRLAEVDEQLTKAARLASLASLADLRAPRPGVVLSVAKGGLGSLMAEGEPVVVLVPTDVALIAEIAIRSSEAGSIAIGDPVTLKIDAFAWRRHGSLQGRLQDVSHGTFTPDGRATALHSGRVTFVGDLTALTPGTGLMPGMTVSAEIKTGTRTVLDYFLEPLMRGVNESLREP